MSDTIETKIDRMFDLPTESTDNETTQVDGGQTDSTERAVDARGVEQQAPAVAGQDEQAASGQRTQVDNKEHAAGRDGKGVTPQPNKTLPANDRGDLVDPTTGAVVAKAGAERKYYELARQHAGNAQFLKSHVENIQREFSKTKTELDAFREAATLPRELNLAPQEVTTAMQFMAHFKQNPLEAAKKMLTEVAAMGYNIEGLGGAVDMAAVARMMDERLAPFKQDRSAQEADATARANADAQLNALYAQHPWAQQQDAELMQLMEADTTLSLREAALTLQSWALQRGYDLNKPLRAQHMAVLNGETQQVQTATQTRPNNAQMAAPNVQQTGVVPRTTTAANHDRRNSDIVAETLREHGINI